MPQLLHTRARDRIRALLCTQWCSAVGLSVARYRRVPKGRANSTCTRTLCVRCLRVGAMGPTADAARIVHAAVCSRLKYWLTKWGSSNVRAQGGAAPGGPTGDRLRTPRHAESRSLLADRSRSPAVPSRVGERCLLDDGLDDGPGTLWSRSAPSRNHRRFIFSTDLKSRSRTSFSVSLQLRRTSLRVFHRTLYARSSQ